MLVSPDYSAEQLAALIAQEPVLAADFIQRVNSPALRRNGREIADLHQAASTGSDDAKSACRTAF